MVESGIKEGDFIVVMVMKAKPETKPIITPAVALDKPQQ